MSIPGQQIINVGAPNNPANSDSLFQAFTTINNNFATLFSTSSPITTISAGNGISVSNSTSAAYQITNTGVTSLIAGQNVTITTLGGSPGSNGALVISSTGTGGNGGGTVDSVGVTSNTISVLNSPITTTGNIQIDLPVISTVAGSYVNANLTVDQFGRIVGASNGSASGSVTSIAVSGGAGMAVSGSPITTSGTITVTNTGVTSIVAGTGIAINQSNGAVTITNTGGGGGGGGTVTRVGVLSNSLTVSGSPIISSGNIQIDLPANLSANVLTATTANLSTINANRFTMISGNNSPLTLTSSTGNSSVSAIISEKSRGNVTNPTAAVVNDSLLSISSKAYTTFNTYQNAGGFSVVLTGTAPNGSSTVSSRAVMSSTSNANVSYSLAVEETGNTFIPGRIQTQQSSNIAQIPSVFLSRARGTDSTNVSQVQVGDTIGRVIGYGYSGNGTTSVGGVNGYTFAGSTDWTVAGLPASSGSQLPTDYTIKTVSTSNVTLSSVFSNTGNLSIPGTFIGSGLSISGTFSVGNISATNISGTLTTAVQPNITQIGTLSSLSVTGNISAGNVTTTNITGTLTTGAQTNITSVGTLGSLSVTGNISAGNVTATRFTGDGSTLTGVIAVSSDVAGTVTTAAQPNITSVGTLSSLSVTGAVTAGSLAGGAATGSGASGTWGINVSGSSATSGTVTTAAQPNITSVGTLSSLSVTGAVTAGSLAGGASTGSGASGTWGINVSGSSSTVTTAAQPNITSVGTLTSLRVSGNANVGGLETTLNATANLTATVTATIPIVVNGVTYKILLST